MTLDLDVEFDLNKLQARFEAIDPEEAGREAVRKVAEDMREEIKAQIVASGIESPARLNSEYGHGSSGTSNAPRSGGPSMVRIDPGGEAWHVESVGEMQYEVFPNPKVRKRAIMLEQGTVGPITPNTADVLVFEVNGVPRFRPEVSGVDAYGYWEKAARNVSADNRLDQYFLNELESQASGGA